jgi:hypothetical protein
MTVKLVGATTGGMIQALLISALGFAFATSTGPRRAHKLTDEVLAYARRLREQDGCGTPARLLTSC